MPLFFLNHKVQHKCQKIMVVCFLYPSLSPYTWGIWCGISIVFLSFCLYCNTRSATRTRDRHSCNIYCRVIRYCRVLVSWECIRNWLEAVDMFSDFLIFHFSIKCPQGKFFQMSGEDKQFIQTLTLIQITLRFTGMG